MNTPTFEELLSDVSNDIFNELSKSDKGMKLLDDILKKHSNPSTVNESIKLPVGWNESNFKQKLQEILDGKIPTPKEIDDDLDLMAFGFKDGQIVHVSPSRIKIRYMEDLANPIHKFEKHGMEWVKSVDFSEPVELGVDKKGHLYLEDGHHRWFASKKLGRKVKGKIVKFEGNPIIKIIQDGSKVPLISESNLGGYDDQTVRKLTTNFVNSSLKYLGDIFKKYGKNIQYKDIFENNNESVFIGDFNVYGDQNIKAYLMFSDYNKSGKNELFIGGKYSNDSNNLISVYIVIDRDGFVGDFSSKYEYLVDKTMHEMAHVVDYYKHYFNKRGSKGFDDGDLKNPKKYVGDKFERNAFITQLVSRAVAFKSKGGSFEGFIKNDSLYLNVIKNFPPSKINNLKGKILHVWNQ